MRVSLVSLALLGYLSQASASRATYTSTSTATHTVKDTSDSCVILGDNIRMYWNISSDGNSISARVDATLTQKWVGIGFQPDGISAMGPGDFATSWISAAGKVFVQDRHLADGVGMPPLDAHQHLLATSAAQNGQTFSFSFTRALSTGDPDDLDLRTIGAQFSLIWAYGATPAEGSQDLTYHFDNHGRVSHVDLFTPVACGTPSPCPNGCSQHGTCDVSKQTCTCDAGWKSYDCSIRDLSVVTLLPGFSIDYYATDVPEARSMTLSGKVPGLTYVGTRTLGNLYALIDKDGDYHVDERITFASKLNMPNGLTWHDGDLYVAEADRIIVFPNIDTNYATTAKYIVLMDKIPTANDNWHAWKYLRVNPIDNLLYFSVGSPCNYCHTNLPPGDPVTETRNTLYGTYNRMSLNGSTFETIAHGIRNSVGFDFHPKTGQLWWTDNGRDEWGANRPSDELNVIDLTQQGIPHYGFPFCYGYGIVGESAGGPDPLFNNGTCDGYVGAKYELGPHVAAIGMQFYTGQSFPTSWQDGNTIIIAEHGSWNRPVNEATGYRVSVVHLDTAGKNFGSEQILAQGFLESDQQTKWARPVDIKILPDGSILVSDDLSGFIFRIKYTAPKEALPEMEHQSTN